MKFLVNIRYFVLIILTVFGSGCISSAAWQEAVQTSKTGVSKTLPGPDGSSHELIQCFDIEVCYKKAGEVCNGKYRIVDNTTSYHDKDTSSLTKLLVKCEVASVK